LIRVILWKELRDLARDRRTLISVVLLPLVGLPGMALLSGTLASTQTVSVAIVVEDPRAQWFAEILAGEIEKIISAMGGQGRVDLLSSGAQPAGYDLVVVLPEGFSDNLTRIDGVAVIRVSSSLGQAGQLALAALQGAVDRLSQAIVVQRVEDLASRAGLEVDPAGFLEPLRVVVGYHTVQGEVASPVEARAAATARILEFALFFVVNPAVVYMADSIVGEKERRTIEKLLVSPAPRRSILAGKIAAATLLGMAAALVDSVGVLLFFYMAGIAVELTLGLAAAWAASAALVVLSTSALVAAVSARSESVRAAQNASFLIVMAALAVYFAALSVDLTSLPPTVSLVLQLLPFTHAALAVHRYALGDPLGSVLHLVVLSAYAVVLVLAAARFFDSEKLIMQR